MKKITIVIVDDHRLLRESWTGILNCDSRLQVIADTGDGLEAIQIIRSLQPDIVLLDINMRPIDGFEVTRQLSDGKSPSRIIGLSVNNSIASVKRLLMLGAMGYLTKNSSREEMIKTIIEVSHGRQYICEEITNSVAGRSGADDDPLSLFNRLTKREIEIGQLVKKGFSSREIALQLKITIKTVEVHRSKSLSKLHLRNSASLINFFNVNGI